MALSGSIVSQTNVSCFGYNNGAVTVAGSGGTSPYQYSLDGGLYQSSGTFTGLSANSYVVTVRDAMLNTFDVGVIITQSLTPCQTGIVITLTTAGEDTGPFDIYSDVDGYVTPFAVDISRDELINGYQYCGIFSGTTNVKIVSKGYCTNNIIVNITPLNAFITEWTVSGDTTARTITLPLHISGGTFNAVVDWGDGSPISTITGATDSNRIHTYSINGVYQVSITGDCPGWSFNNTGDRLKITDIISWGTSPTFGGFSYIRNGFSGCSNLISAGIGKIIPKIDLVDDGCRSIFNSCSSLTTIPSGLFDNCVNVRHNAFFGTFSGCNSLQSIPNNLFDNCVNVDQLAFQHTFISCTSLTNIPTDLFKYNTGNTSFIQTFSDLPLIQSIPNGLFDTNILVTTFNRTFANCAGIQEIPVDLFKYNVNATGFPNTFDGCSSIVTIPTDLFRYNTAVTSFSTVFANCTSLTGITENIFDTCTAVTSFFGAFQNNTSLTYIPVDLFRYNTGVTTFNMVFENCTSLQTVPDGLFAYNLNAFVFTSTFNQCLKLQINPWTFYLTSGDTATRFLNQSILFNNCFRRTSFTGVQGTAPDLWNCNFGTGTPTITNCFDGAGNSLTSISNYNDIPIGWL